MECYTTDALRDMARPSHEAILPNIIKAQEKAKRESDAAHLIRSFLSPIVPIHMWYVSWLRADISVYLQPLPLRNAIDMMDAHRYSKA